jgi:hypothetical protein
MNPAPGFAAQPDRTSKLAAAIATPAIALRETLFTCVLLIF